jgi:hypothetical protein
VVAEGAGQDILGRGLHPSPSQLNFSRFLHKIHPKHPRYSLIYPDTSKHPLNNT